MQAATTQGKHNRQTNDSLKCLLTHTHEHTRTHTHTQAWAKTIAKAHKPKDWRASTLGACLMAFVANQWIIYVPRFCLWPTHTDSLQGSPLIIRLITFRFQNLFKVVTLTFLMILKQHFLKYFCIYEIFVYLVFIFWKGIRSLCSMSCKPKVFCSM